MSQRSIRKTKRVRVAPAAPRGSHARLEGAMAALLGNVKRPAPRAVSERDMDCDDPSVSVSAPSFPFVEVMLSVICVGCSPRS